MVVGNPQPHSLALSRDHSNHHLSFPLLPIFPPPLRLPLPLLIPTISLPLPLLLTRFFNFFLFFSSTSAYSTTNLHVILRCYLLIECLVIPFLLQCQLINTVKIVTSSSFSYKLQTPMLLFTPINHACIIGNTTRKFPVPPIKKTPILDPTWKASGTYTCSENVFAILFLFFWHEAVPKLYLFLVALQQEANKYYFVVANAKFMLDEEEHFKELLFERLRNYGERNKEQDFWLVIEPKFLDKFPNITKRLKRPAVALVSTNGTWMT